MAHEMVNKRAPPVTGLAYHLCVPSFYASNKKPCIVLPSSGSMGDVAHDTLGTSVAFSIAFIMVLSCSHLMYGLSVGWLESLGRDAICGGACVSPCDRCVALGCGSLEAGILDLATHRLRKKNPGAAHKCSEQRSPLLLRNILAHQLGPLTNSLPSTHIS